MTKLFIFLTDQCWKNIYFVKEKVREPTMSIQVKTNPEQAPVLNNNYILATQFHEGSVSA